MFYILKKYFSISFVCFPPKLASASCLCHQNHMIFLMMKAKRITTSVTGTTQQCSTLAPSAANDHCNDMKQERMNMGARRLRQLVPAAASLAIMLCCRLVNGGSSLISNTSARKLRGMDSFRNDARESQVMDLVEDMCDGRPRNHSLSWTAHDEDWHRQCHLHWHEADSLSPSGQWTQTEFTNFVKLQIQTSFTDFKQLPLPLTMIFNELSCRCEGSDCCHGPNAKIEPNTNGDEWMDSICNRVDNALDEVCRRQQRQSQGSEL